MTTIGNALATYNGTVMLPTKDVGETKNVDVPIAVSTNSEIVIAQFVVEYNSHLLTYVNARLGANAPSGFSISNTNPNLPFGPTTPGTNENILVQVAGGGSESFSGSNLEIVILEFNLVGNFGESSPLAFDEAEDRTSLSTSDLDEIAGSDLEFINGGVNYALPVEMSSFHISDEHGRIILKWTTESESNNFGFEIERKNASLDFERIGFVAGRGTTTSQQKYQYIDTNLPTGTYGYRLKQIDHDGSFTYSEVKSITILPPRNFDLKENFPNPFNPGTVIEYQIPHDIQVNLRILNLMGQEIAILVNEFQKSGFHQVTWEGKDMSGREVSSGIYLYSIQAGEYHAIRKMVKLE